MIHHQAKVFHQVQSPPPDLTWKWIELETLCIEGSINHIGSQIERKSHSWTSLTLRKSALSSIELTLGSNLPSPTSRPPQPIQTPLSPASSTSEKSDSDNKNYRNNASNSANKHKNKLSNAKTPPCENQAANGEHGNPLAPPSNATKRWRSI